MGGVNPRRGHRYNFKVMVKNETNLFVECETKSITASGCKMIIQDYCIEDLSFPLTPAQTLNRAKSNPKKNRLYSDPRWHAERAQIRADRETVAMRAASSTTITNTSSINTSIC